MRGSHAGFLLAALLTCGAGQAADWSPPRMLSHSPWPARLQYNFGWAIDVDAAGVLPPGAYDYLTEVNFAAEGLVRTIAASLEAGVAIFIDYGFPEGEYYHPQRSMGTLRCHYRHRFHGDPFFLPGLQDITAHVDFTAMSRAAEQGGAEVYGFTTQAYFLISCGLAVLVSAGDPTMTLSRLKGTSAVHRLIGPSEMGELFKVLAFGKGMQEPILGMQSARHLQL